MKPYEFTCLISPELSEEEINSFQEKIKTLFQEEGGISSEENAMVKRGSMANLFTLNFQLSPEKIQGLGKKLKSEKQILRYIILFKPRTKKISTRIRRPLKRVETATLKSKPKVELKEIEKKLDEILDESK